MRLPIRAGTFFTLKGWMKKQELARFVAPDTALPVCEMETFALAEVSLRHKLPFFAVRAVSDAADVDLAFDPQAVCDNAGTYRLTRCSDSSSPGRAFLPMHYHSAEARGLLTQPGPGSERLTSGIVAVGCPGQVNPSRHHGPGKILAMRLDSLIGRNPMEPGPHE